jgi:hypothetical protein
VEVWACRSTVFLYPVGWFFHHKVCLKMSLLHVGISIEFEEPLTLYDKCNIEKEF